MQQVTTDEWLEPLRERELIPDGCLAALVVGSSARGWNNTRSDHDVYVITSRGWDTPTSRPIPVPLDPPGVCSETFHQDGRRWEVTYWLDGQIEQLLSKVSWAQYERAPAGEVLTPREEVSLGRIANCLTLLGEDWITERRRRLADSAFQSLLVVRSLNLADDAAEDALGQLESGNTHSATLSARRAFGHAVDALLESHGEFGSHMPKWRPNRLRIVAPQFLPFERYWALETMRGYDDTDPKPWIREVLALCQDICLRVETP
ncbi:hypothetical protein ACFV0T_25600 [Streptomyces sp. NPDC059582]|uniref:hypothetical protein n=1 Tax=Streptomyces sp. NPDC059582 TaxID=3346875 RepID=UPI00367E4146